MKRFIALLLTAAICLPLVCCNTGNSNEKQPEYDSIVENLQDFPISFKYGDKEYRGFGKDFTETQPRTTEDKGNGGVTTVIYMKHTLSGADFRLETCIYEEYDAWDYTLYITNNTQKTTNKFSNINAIDIVFEGSNPVIKGISGDVGKDMYKPYAIALNEDTSFVRESTSGRPTHSVFPYFNLEYDNGGTFIAIGWPACWKAEARTEDNKTYFTGGQLDISTVLEPGDTIRTPLIAMVNYKGRDDAVNMNKWRRWFIDCNMHKVDDEPIEPLLVDWTLAQGQTTSTVLRTIKGYASHGVTLDCFWLDAGWYTKADGSAIAGWTETGTLMIDETRFPDKFTSISQELSKTGGKFLLWFEPEVVRVDKKSFLDNMTDFNEAWLLGAAAEGSWLEGQLMDLGNKDCREWITSRILKIIKEANVSIYRQDFNVDPGPVWRSHDTEEKTGFVENQYVMGYLDMWDTLLVEVPGLRIDSCASGGGRNDLETMRRSVPMHNSDYWDGNGTGYDERQATMMSFMQWIPYTKFWMSGDDSQGSYLYRARSCYTQMLALHENVMSKLTDWDNVKKVVDEWRFISQYFYSDFYTLTQWSNASDVWRGWEYFDTNKNSGYAQLFRAADSTISEQTVRFYGLDANCQYRIYDTDGTFSTVVSGKVLMEEGLSITLPTPLYAMVIYIQAA